MSRAVRLERAGGNTRRTGPFDVQTNTRDDLAKIRRANTIVLQGQTAGARLELNVGFTINSMEDAPKGRNLSRHPELP